MEKKIDTHNLDLGMYVSRLDRPWTDTPFLFQGFVLRDREDIETLQRYCKYVFISEQEERVTSVHDLQPTGLALEDEAPPLADASLPVRETHYRDVVQVEEELPRAKSIIQAIENGVREFVTTLRAGNKLDLRRIKPTVDELVESVVRNPDAMLWLSRLKRLGEYAYDHAIETSVMSVMFGRHLGLSHQDLKNLGLGGLLFDIGKVKLPPNLLNKPGKLTEDEFDEMRRHVDYGVEILLETPGVPPSVIDIARTHHERHNGRGYPQGLTGDQLTVLSKIVAIVDCFDAITSMRPYQPSISAHHAIRQMYEWRGNDFQEELLEQFIQCLGVYPTGTIVELTTGEIGIIAAQNRTRRLRPRVMLILDQHKVAIDRNPIIDLAEVVQDSDGHKLEIVRSHDLGAFGIDPKAYFL